MDKVIEMFKDETQLVQAESAYDMAMKRIGAEHPEINPDSYSDRVWFVVAGVVVHDDYEAAKEYAQTALVHI